MSRDEFNRKKREEDMKSVDYHVALTAEKVDILQLRLDQMQEQLNNSPAFAFSQSTAVSKLPKALNQRLKRVEDHISFPEYNPVSYSALKVLKKPVWADPIDLLELNPKSRPLLSWQNYDTSCQTDRQSYLGEYKVRDGLPINPRGRTGVIGRGLLGRWGPNHAGDPIVTRWKRDIDGNRLMENDKPLLEFAAIQRRDNRQLSFPGGICPPGSDVSQTLKKEFTEEAMAGDTGTAISKQKLDELFTGGTEVYRGYADDPRNTDNAWLETRVVHDEEGEILPFIKLLAGRTEIVVTWLTGSSKISMYGSHQYFMKTVVDKMLCAF